MQQLVRYFQQSGNELRKVTWPTRRQAMKLTIAVIVFSIVLSLVIGLIDLGFTKVLQTIILKG